MTNSKPQLTPHQARFPALFGGDTPSVPPADKPRRQNAVVTKILGYNRFLDGLTKRKPRLRPLSVALWCWLWKCERKGVARCTLAKLADRFAVSRSTVHRHLAKLRDAGFLKMLRPGKPGKTASVYRIRPSAKRQ